MGSYGEIMSLYMCVCVYLLVCRMVSAGKVDTKAIEFVHDSGSKTISCFVFHFNSSISKKVTDIKSV